MEIIGREYVKQFSLNLTSKSGVYQMVDANGVIVYIGKAKNLKNRVSSYTNINALSNRIMRMISMVAKIEILITASEAEALLLEASLIKKHQPKYNILLKDDKAYPYIRFSNHEFTRIDKHRGKQNAQDKYFGPFASAGLVDQTITILQKAFLLRPCSDNVFNNRSRPCLQYQIKRCSAPCVGYVSEIEYNELRNQAELFLRGKSKFLQEKLSEKMQAASQEMQYEKASQYRDRIRILTQVQNQQSVFEHNISDADVIACYIEDGQACVQLWFFRGGQHFGNNAYFPANIDEASVAAVTALFIGQYYQNHPIPQKIYLHDAAEGTEVLQDALTMLANHKVELVVPKRGSGKKIVDELHHKAIEALQKKIAERSNDVKYLQAVSELFGLPIQAKRIEVYDNSHIAGEYAVGAMIVAGENGFEPNEYRRFNFRNPQLVGGDDYAMMREVLTRRLKKLKNDSEEIVPDLLLIDGGKGQHSAVLQVMQELAVNVPFVCISKGENRNAGRETFIMQGREPFQLPHSDSTLHYLQRLRDEAHRFAITSHRIKRANAIKHSSLDEIAGIGASRKRALLLHFGSAKDVMNASVLDLQQVKGINASIAKQIYDYFHQ
jgi:excinuclease ABC subunit C